MPSQQHSLAARRGWELHPDPRTRWEPSIRSRRNMAAQRFVLKLLAEDIRPTPEQLTALARLLLDGAARDAAAQAETVESGED